VPNFVKIGQSVAKIFRFFKMAATAILDFRNREFLFAKFGEVMRLGDLATVSQ